MSALVLMSLLAATLVIPIFMDDGEDTSETPDEPQGIDGTEGPDVQTAQSGQEINGLGGDDTMTTAEDSDGAIINRGADNDTLELNGTNATACGGAGDDEINVQGPLGSVDGGRAIIRSFTTPRPRVAASPF